MNIWVGELSDRGMDKKLDGQINKGMNDMVHE